ncbi:MAG TPA: hypothetical protein VMV81_05135 [Phycisphaerae bacterium]|nr:hypothetical protein [Phycisphaerae bacterium]
MISRWNILAFGALIFLVAGVAGATQPAPQDQPKDDRPPMAGPRGRGDDQPRGGPMRQEMRRRMMERRNGKQADDNPPPIPDEMIDFALDAMKTKLPRLHDRLTVLRAKDPKRFEQVFRKLLPIFHEYRDLKERRPDIAEKVMEDFQAEEKLRELSNEYLTIKDDSARQTAISQEMEQLVKKQLGLRRERFEARLKEFEDRIKDQQLQLETMRDRLSSMTKRGDEFVNRRVEQIKAGRMGEPVPGMEPLFGPPRGGGGLRGGPGRPGPGGFGAPGDRPPPRGGERPPEDGPDGDRPPPPPGGPGGPPPDGPND